MYGASTQHVPTRTQISNLELETHTWYSIIILYLTSACTVHSNIYGLCNFCWVRYLTAVDSILSTFSAIQIYHHLTSVHIEIPRSIRLLTRNCSSIGEEPNFQGSLIFTSIISLATSCKVSHAEQSSVISFTNVLQGHETVVLVCCTIEREPDISQTWEKRDCYFNHSPYGNLGRLRGGGGSSQKL